MRLTGRRESSNVDDRRGVSGGVKKLGIGGVVLIAVVTFLSGGDLGDVITNVMQNSSSITTQTENQTTFTAEEEELATFSKQILAGTEDVWTEIFKKMGKTYTPPTLVLFTNSVTSGCGSATSSTGPFYCSADQKVYIDLSFFTQMKSQLGAGGDFSYAYVIAHEVGHHVQYLLGSLSEAHNQMNRVSETEANKISVRLELLADYYAGIWAHYDNEKFQSLEDGDVEEALDCAAKIGDNYLQEKSQGYSQPESFTHGTSEQRAKWLKMGIKTGDYTKTTFGIPESSL